jgi:hypothetical protein
MSKNTTKKSVLSKRRYVMEYWLYLFVVILAIAMAGYYYFYIPFSEPIGVSNEFEAGALIIPLTERGTNYIAGTVIFFFLGLACGLILYVLTCEAAHSKSKLFVKRNVISWLIMFSIAYVCCTTLVLALIIPLIGYKDAQFSKNDIGRALALSEHGISIPFALIHGDIMPPFQRGKIQEYMLVQNMPSLFISWENITSWEITEYHSARSRMPVFVLNTNDQFKEISIKRNRIKQYDQVIIDYMDSKLKNKRVVTQQF